MLSYTWEGTEIRRNGKGEIVKVRPTMCEDCYFSEKYALARLVQPEAWAAALDKCRNLASPEQFCHHEEGFYCAGMAAWQKKNLGRVSDVAAATLRVAAVVVCVTMLMGCAHPRPHVSWPTERPDYDARWKCEYNDPHNSAKDCVKRTFHYRVPR